MYIDQTVYTGRPSDTRIPKEERCYELLDRLGIAYTRVDHEHADTIEACKEIEKLLGCEICKNLFLTNRQMTEVWLLLMPGEKPFKTKLLSKQISACSSTGTFSARSPSACTRASIPRPCASKPRT